MIGTGAKRKTEEIRRAPKSDFPDNMLNEDHFFLTSILFLGKKIFSAFFYCFSHLVIGNNLQNSYQCFWNPLWTEDDIRLGVS